MNPSAGGTIDKIEWELIQPSELSESETSFFAFDQIPAWAVAVLIVAAVLGVGQALFSFRGKIAAGIMYFVFGKQMS